LWTAAQAKAGPAPTTAEPPSTIIAALPPPRAALTPAPAPAAPTASAPVVKAQPEMSAADKARAENMIVRGDAYMNQGNYAAARQFFRIAAELGHALGAMRLGTTYDPIELATTSIVGLQPDPKQAAIWYEKARSLGAADAAQRLSRLPAAK
jgi:TPR repeat protein